MEDIGNMTAGLKDIYEKRLAGWTGRTSIRVAADDLFVSVRVGSEASAGLTVSQARYMARELYRMARLVEQRANAK